MRKKHLFYGVLSVLFVLLSISNASAEITTTLKLGDTHPQVTLLQKILNSIGKIIAPTGPGSKGNETDRFGSLTASAVKAFQCDESIVCSGTSTTTGWGIVGPKTRSLLNRLGSSILGFFSNSSPKSMLAGGAGISGPSGYWKFDETSGTAQDSSGNGRTVGLNNGAVFASGKFGNALSLDGTNYAKTTASISLPNTFSVSAWVKVNAMPTPGASANLVDNAYNNAFSLNAYNAGNGSYISWVVGGQPVIVYSSPISTGTWVHVVGTYDGTIAKVYINGDPKESADVSQYVHLNSTNLPVYFGTYSFDPGNNANFNGFIDDVRLYDYALSPTEVTSVYNSVGDGGSTTHDQGECGDAVNQCTNGTLNDIADTATDYLWECKGLNNAATATCDNPISSAPGTYTLSITSTNGTVAKSPSAASYAAGTSVTLAATPNTGYTFSGWSGGGCSGTGTTCTVTMNADTSVIATFAAVTTGPPDAPGVVDAKGVTANQINIAWSNSTSTIQEASFNVYRDGTKIGSSPAIKDSDQWHEPSMFQDVNLSPSTSYTYQITSVGADGSESAKSSSVIATTLDASQTGLIPPNRIINRTVGVTVGVPGGIPTDRVKCVTTECQALENAASGYKDRSIDASSLINSAIVSAPDNSYVFIPAGKYKAGVYIARNNVTVRGAGVDLTTIDAISMRGGGGDGFYNQPFRAVLSGATKGSTSISVSSADASAISKGSLIQISADNNLDPLEISPSGYQRARKQNMVVTDKIGSTIYFTPALMSNTYTNPVIMVSAGKSSFVGIEDLTVDGSIANPQVTVSMQAMYASWIKNVKMKGATNYTLSMGDGLQNEVRHSILEGTTLNASNHAGLLMGDSTGTLFEDNIVTKTFPVTEINAGSAGNVFAYNFMTGTAANTNHGAHNSFNLFEGNIMDGIFSDGYYGSESEQTVFRNWVTGSGFGAIAKRFSRNFSYVGNQIGTDGSYPGLYSFGQPNLGNGDSTGWAAPSAGIYWQNWNPTAGPAIRGVLTRISDHAGSVTLSHSDALKFAANGSLNVGLDWGNGRDISKTMVDMSYSQSGDVLNVSGGYVINDLAGVTLPPSGTMVGLWPRSEGFQERDLDVSVTTILKANRYAGISGYLNNVNESLGSYSLPDSLYLTSKPAFFGNLAWPAFSPTSPNQSVDAIPAGYRYNHPGLEAPGVVGGSIPPPPDITAPSVSIIAPTNNATISNSILINIDATDNVGVAGVQLKLDGTNLGSEITGGVFSGTWDVSTMSDGAYTLTAVARDAAGNISTSTPITVTVHNVATPFSLDPIGNRSIAEASTLSFTLSSQSSKPVTYTASSLPSGATFVNGAFSWTPNYTQAGTYNVTFTASDGTLTDSENVQITVTNTNRPPTVYISLGQETRDAVQMTAASDDADNDPLTYIWTNTAGTGAVTFDPTNTEQEVQAILPPLSTGGYTFRVTVSDGNGGSAFAEYTSFDPNPDSDSDMVLDIADKCPGTPSGDRPVNKSGCPIPKASNFTLSPSNITDTNAFVDLKALSTLEIGNSFGKITWNTTGSTYPLVKNTTYGKMDIDSNITITKGTIGLNSAILPELNRQATLTFYNVVIKNPAILKDGALCTNCIVKSYSGTTLVVSVPGFSTYTIAEEADVVPPVVISTPVPNGGGGKSIGIFTPTTDKAIPPDLGCVAGAAFSTTTGKKCSATIPVAYKFTKSLKIGMKDAEVKTLQQFLNNSGFTVAVSGSGSKGNETTYFGPATQKALISYQKSKGIVPAAGYFGPLTIASITGVTINSNTIPASTYAKSVYTVPTSVPAPFTSSKKSASASGSVGLGSSGDTVKTLRTRLRDQGYLPEYGVSGAPASASLETGYFNAETEAALKKFQCDWHIVCTGSPDTTGWGVLGERTIQKFNSL